MQALCERAPDIEFTASAARPCGAGLRSLFDINDISVMGFLPVITRLPLLIRRISKPRGDRRAAPDALVIIDSAGLHASRGGRFAPRASIPIINYVSPTCGHGDRDRARKMRAYVDHLLALLPFEPQAHADLGGPPTTYVGHPLMERLDEFRPARANTRETSPPNLLVLPGSRRAEITA